MRPSFHKWLFLAAALLSGCTSTSTVVLQPDSPVAVPNAQPLQMNAVRWQVLSLEQLRQLVAQLEHDHKDTILFALDGENYNNLSVNLIEIERYINEQKAILAMLKKIIAERAATGANKKP